MAPKNLSGGLGRSGARQQGYTNMLSPKDINSLPSPSPSIPGSRRRIVQRYKYDAPNRHFAAQTLADNELFGNMLYMYDKIGYNTSLDILLNGTTSRV